ncbi:MAG: TIGR01777 family protein [Flavobacterium sp.]|nr:MAG: TIGR01777 family protein [Flavobacterium sp.]
MKVLITGATGLIGSRLAKACQANGYIVNYLTTSKEKVESDNGLQGYYWNPKKGELDDEALSDVSVIFHLAGASISKRWTKSYRKTIIDSRIQTANLLFRALQKKTHTVEHFISASGVGIYPASYTNLYTEESDEVNSAFLGEVVRSWEQAANQFESLGLAVTKVRTGLVLAADGGALPEIARPIKMSVGAPLGSGRQWQSWIHIEDMIRLYLFILEENLEGIFNAVAPNPVTNARLTKSIAKVLQKPLWLPNIPSFVLRLILGDMSRLILEGQLVSSEKIEKHGFSFHYTQLENALQDLLKK